MSIYKKAEGIPWAKGWGVTCNETHRQLMGRCVVNPKHKAEDVHHVYYRRWFWLPWPKVILPGVRPIAGLERPGIDVFSVCEACHQRLHHPSMWYQEPGEKDQNGNYLGTIIRLRMRWKFWRAFGRIFPATFSAGLRPTVAFWIAVFIISALSVFAGGYLENIFHQITPNALLQWEVISQDIRSHLCQN